MKKYHYEQLLPYEANKIDNPNSFSVLLGDFVTTEDGTGIVHTAPAFGADDYRVGKKYDIGILIMVDKQGKFVDEVTDFAGRYVKEEYYTQAERDADDRRILVLGQPHLEPLRTFPDTRDIHRLGHPYALGFGPAAKVSISASGNAAPR